LFTVPCTKTGAITFKLASNTKDEMSVDKMTVEKMSCCRLLHGSFKKLTNIEEFHPFVLVKNNIH
jgi:hypothetical protein